MAASTALTREQRTQRARLAALTRWSKEDPTANAERGQAGLLDRFGARSPPSTRTCRRPNSPAALSVPAGRT